MRVHNVGGLFYALELDWDGYAVTHKKNGHLYRLWLFAGPCVAEDGLRLRCFNFITGPLKLTLGLAPKEDAV